MNTIVVQKTALEQTIKALKVMQDKGILIFGPEGMKATVVSLDHTAIVHAVIPKESFKDYKVTDTIEFGTDLEEFAKKAEEFETETVTIEIGEKVKLTAPGLTFGIALQDVKQESGLPKIEFTTSFTVPVAVLKKILRRVGKVNDKFMLTAAEALSIFSRGDLPDSIYEEIIDAPFNGEATAYYTLKYLVPALNATSAENAVVSFKENGPIQVAVGNVSYFIGSMQNFKW